MVRYVSLVVIAVLMVVLFGGVRDARAGGIILYELGTSDVGRASAGWAARSGDAATLFTNPAGMSRMPDQELLVGGQLMYGNFSFENVPVGRQSIEISYIGYHKMFIPNLLLTSGKEVVINVKLEEKAYAVDEITIRPERKKERKNKFYF